MPSPDWAVAVGGSVWIAGVGKGVQRFDAARGAATGAEVAVYSVCSSMDQGFDSVWAVSCDMTTPHLVRIDTRTGAAVTIPLPARLPAESSVGAGEEGVWLLTSGDPPQLVMVDPQTNAVGRSFPAPPGGVAVRSGFGSVWVSVAAPGRLVRLDPASGHVVATVPVGRGASFLAVGPDAVWVINASDRSVSRVDPATNAVTATVAVASQVISGGDIAAAADAVWVRVKDAEALAVRIDPRSNAVVERYGPGSGSGGIAIADDSVWITAGTGSSIWRLPR